MTSSTDSLRPESAPTISDLPALVGALPAKERQRFDRLIRVTQATGQLRPPESMHAWITKLFGSVAAVEQQTIVKTTNLVTMEGTLFNALRASRPFESGHSEEVDQVVSSGAGDPFCNPLEGTPEDIFGRVRGEHSITASTRSISPRSRFPTRSTSGSSGASGC